ncbi:hypothetical protein [Flagellimonas myxillae]|nr:hypothetical protein [Muricauda myxillae]MCL6265659.1 hypothetical protein [Muricauda myxillae]
MKLRIFLVQMQGGVREGGICVWMAVLVFYQPKAGIHQFKRGIHKLARI